MIDFVIVIAAVEAFAFLAASFSQLETLAVQFKAFRFLADAAVMLLFLGAVDRLAFLLGTRVLLRIQPISCFLDDLKLVGFQATVTRGCFSIDLLGDVSEPMLLICDCRRD